MYTGNSAAARATYKYFAPSLQESERLFAELTSDQQALSQFLVTGSKVFGVLADRSEDLSELTSNANQAFGAIAAENEAFSRDLELLPPTMRQANTTFVNLRAALDDLDPLVDDTREVMPELAPFLRSAEAGRARLGAGVPRPRAARSTRPGANNDLTDALRLAPGVRRARPAARSSPRSPRSRDSQHLIEFARPYSPDLLAVARQARRRGRLLRLQRPLRARPARWRQRLRLQRGHRRSSTRSRSTQQFDAFEALGFAPHAALPRRRHAAERRAGRAPPTIRSSTTAHSPASASPPTCRRGHEADPGHQPSLLVACVVLLFSGGAAGGDEGTYEVRAVFDNASFLVEGEDVRVAGAKVGSVAAVDIAEADEAVREDGSPAPGKAIVILQIDDAAFHDFRTDASCLIRPQSLIGEKFVECKPTEPRAPGTPVPPELEQVPEGEPGEGQYLLPLERNGKAIDLDLVNNIMEEPYPDRFRLILNDLGAGLAARGEELARDHRARQPGAARDQPRARHPARPESRLWPTSRPTASR